jgi:hypothetical protein
MELSFSMMSWGCTSGFALRVKNEKWIMNEPLRRMEKQIENRLIIM